MTRWDYDDVRGLYQRAEAAEKRAEAAETEVGRLQAQIQTLKDRILYTPLDNDAEFAKSHLGHGDLSSCKEEASVSKGTWIGADPCDRAADNPNCSLPSKCTALTAARAEIMTLRKEKLLLTDVLESLLDLSQQGPYNAQLHAAQKRGWDALHSTGWPAKEG